MTSRIGKKKRSNRRGFTLIELVIVAAIILLMVSVSTPLFRNTFRDLEFRDAAYNIGKVIQYAQQRAIIEEKRYKLKFDFDKRAYRLFVEGEKKVEAEPPQEGGIAAEEAAFAWEKSTGKFGSYFYLPEDVTLKGEKEEIIFLPNGRCDIISLYLVNKENKIFKIDTNGRAGYVKVVETKEE